ncbi:hypothetical protein BKA67DRAFT_520658 [Truncatella angustata]|uniref:SMP-LTD domain-containing protein n=1 Tax=Truncatella angustata TaxID=152316 RepID=A0A9P8UGC4_9PEZI|nr:uncharacterized protein BKA67DRAFT_520658 [Truncatella angustata]KAH6651787.1 hypothetical protein BKA67DRAFT_520658 [Truncatella angustata]KAH8196332.1 hypothetical protein TruAng_009510 [Truncatella angustata]
MGSWAAFLLAYLLGGVTFIPLALAIAWFTLPQIETAVSETPRSGDDIVQPGDDTKDLDQARKEEKGESKQKYAKTTDVAAGYFAVCREYTPMGINAKPIERATPVGSATVAAPSRSVYQTMYQSIFDRKQTAGPLEGNGGANVRPKRAGNVFYVVLRHGHLMLFDDDEQLEVRHVVSLAHHDVSIYSGGDNTPEGELFIKRNALCLSRKIDGPESPDIQISKPFFLFCENCSAKEDFYFALLRNQEHVLGAANKAPEPLQFEVKNIISLVQRLHSSEEHMQTRWLNALIGRIFLAIYKTKDIENLIREKITKKISRVKRPSILSKIAIQKIDTGDSAPFITNPRLKDLTVEGEWGMEADVKYTGNFRLEVAATVKIDLGSRFKTREVNLVLAVVLKKLEGHLLFKVKPPPSNRLWFSFQTMPKMEMTIEPIVSSRQITYTVILRQIENRIKEVVAETLVLPMWDDMPFFKTEHKQWRGGIFEGDDAVQHSEDYEEIAAMLGDVEEVSHIEETGMPTSPDLSELPLVEKSHSVPSLETTQPAGFWGRKGNAMKAALASSPAASASTTALDSKNGSPGAETPPRPIRAGSFSTSTPTISTDSIHADAFKPSATPPDRDDAASVMASLAATYEKGSPAPAPGSTPTRPTSAKQSSSASSSNEALETVPRTESTPTGPGRRNTASSVESTGSETSFGNSSARSARASIKSSTGSVKTGLFTRRDTSMSTNSTNTTPEQKRNTLAAVSKAAATAKQWGWNAMQRRAENAANNHKLSDPPAVDLNQPMGRGQPLPPPGMPLPGPARGSKVTPIAVPKRKPIPPPNLPAKNGAANNHEAKNERRPVPPPPLPRRRRVSEAHGDDMTEEHVLVVEAPADSEPNTPLRETHEQDIAPSYVQPWVEDNEELDMSGGHSTPHEPVSVSTKVSHEKSNLHSASNNQSNHQSNHCGGIREEEEDEDEYSSWLDNPEFVAEGQDAAITAGQTH